MSVTYTQQMFSATDDNNLPLSYGRLYLYKSGTDIPMPIYSSNGSTFTIVTQPYILNISGQADNLYLSSGNTGPYRIVLTDSLGNIRHPYPIDNCDRIIQTYYSNSEISTIVPTVTLDYVAPPVVNGTDYHIEAIATGDNIRYQWFKNGIPVPQYDYLLEFVPITAGDAGTYYVEVYNSLGTAVSQSVTITVI
jgi:hypothetical protein